MSEIKDNVVTYRTAERYRSKRKKRLENIKAGGDMMMYIGSASLIMPMVQKARENRNGIMGTCALSAGVILSIGIGNFASKILNQTIDKAVAFWEEVKPNGPEKNPEKKTGEEEENG